MRGRVHAFDTLASGAESQSLFKFLRVDLKDMHSVSVHGDCRG